MDGLTRASVTTSTTLVRRTHLGRPGCPASRSPGKERWSSTVKDDEALDGVLRVFGRRGTRWPRIRLERLKLGGELQARARGLQPWIMARRRRADSLLERFCTSKHVSGFGVVSLQFRRCEWMFFTAFSRSTGVFWGWQRSWGAVFLS